MTARNFEKFSRLQFQLFCDKIMITLRICLGVRKWSVAIPKEVSQALPTKKQHKGADGSHMLHLIVSGERTSLLALGGILFAFVATVLATAKLGEYLPRDEGREFAHDGKLSAGKPRGAGIIFVLAFVAAALLFAPLNVETVIYLLLVVVCMITGYLDDAAKTPWGEFRKGFLDLCVAVLTAMNFLKFNSSRIELAFFNVWIDIPRWVFIVLAVILIWVSVNVTNCSDGVDGLSGTLTIISLMTIYLADRILNTGNQFPYLILLFSACILGYLWYNATPSRLMYHAFWTGNLTNCMTIIFLMVY